MESIPSGYVAWRAGTITLFLYSVLGPHRLFKNSSSEQEIKAWLGTIDGWITNKDGWLNYEVGWLLAKLEACGYEIERRVAKIVVCPILV